MPSSFQRYARERAWSCGKESQASPLSRVVLAHRAPGALAQVRAPLVPRVRGEEVVLGAAGRLGEAARARRSVLASASGSVPRERCQVEEVPGPRRRARRRARRGGRRRCARSARRWRRRRAATCGRAGRPTAARRGRTPARRRGSRRRACAARRRASPRRRGSARCRCPPSRARSPSCHSPSRKTRSRERGEQPLVERPQVGVGRLVGPAGEEDRQRARAAPRAGPRARAARRSGSAS